MQPAALERASDLGHIVAGRDADVIAAERARLEDMYDPVKPTAVEDLKARPKS